MGTTVMRGAWPVVLCALLLSATASLAQAPAAQATGASSGRTVRYDLDLKQVKYVYGVADPVMRLRPGDTLETNTTDGDGFQLREAGIKPGGPNPLNGPFYIEGAMPGDTLVIHFLSVETNAPVGYGSAGPGFGAINSTNYTPMINPPIPHGLWTYKIDTKNQVAIFQAKDSKFTTTIPLHPFVGSIGVAPAKGEVRGAIVPAEFGGNMDAPEASTGNTLYLPVNVPGALLYMGDGHAAMGDGEIDGTAIEIQLKLKLKIDVVKNKRIDWPRFENDESIMAVGIYRPLDDSLRIAYTELVKWIQSDYGLSAMDAYELLSKTGEVHVDQMVDPNYTVVAKIKKRFLPEKKQ